MVSSSGSTGTDDRLLLMLQRLLAIRAADQRPAIDEASTISPQAQ